MVYRQKEACLQIIRHPGTLHEAEGLTWLACQDDTPASGTESRGKLGHKAVVIADLFTAKNADCPTIGRVMSRIENNQGRR